MAKSVEAQLGEILVRYTEKFTKDMKQGATEVTKQALQEVRNDSPVRWGQYSASWRSKKVYESPFELKLVVHNQIYQLPHLLEHGHASRNGGFTPGFPHIRPAEEKAVKEFEKRVKEAAKG